MMLCSLGLGQEGYQLESDKATRGLYSRWREIRNCRYIWRLGF